jgi:Reverse transcriptase (RNA-dependent DNA polymerase)
MANNCDIVDINDALEGSDKLQWINAIKSEVESLDKLCVFKRVTFPDEKRIMESKIILRYERDESGNVIRHNAQIVARGFKQVIGEDYQDVYSPTLSKSVFCLFIGIVASNRWFILKADVKTAFLYAELEHDIYCLPPKDLGKIYSDIGAHAWKLKCALYGFKQASFQWFHILDQTVQKLV